MTPFELSGLVSFNSVLVFVVQVGLEPTRPEGARFTVW